jgi:hypothetical protein
MRFDDGMDGGEEKKIMMRKQSSEKSNVIEFMFKIK